MRNEKLSEKQLLEQLQAKLTLTKGKKISQQKVLDKCIQFSSNNFEHFLQEEFDEPFLSLDKIKKILKNTINTGYHYPEKSDDELIYGL